LKEKEQQEADLLEKEKHYNNLQEEVEDCRKIVKKLKQKNKTYQNELKDINRENLDQNQELIGTVREQSKELDFLSQLVSYLVTDEHMYKIKEKTDFDEETGKWKLVPFQLK
jgi:septal ring factor EnvC (AmiA/AmiB activator)